MDISTKQVIKQTLATTHTHAELDNMVEVETKIADVSFEYKAYSDYDVAEVPIIDASVIEEFRKKEDLMRNTHLNLDADSSTYYKDLYQFYIDNKLYPTTFFFGGIPTT